MVNANIYTGKTTMQYIEMSTPRESVVVSTSTYDGLVYDIATLSSASGLFVGINQDESPTADTATVFAGMFTAFYVMSPPSRPFCRMCEAPMVCVCVMKFMLLCMHAVC